MLQNFKVTKIPCSTDTIGYNPIKRIIEIPPNEWCPIVIYRMLDKSKIKIPGAKYTPNLNLSIKSPKKIIQS